MGRGGGKIRIGSVFGCELELGGGRGMFISGQRNYSTCRPIERTDHVLTNTKIVNL